MRALIVDYSAEERNLLQESLKHDDITLHYAGNRDQVITRLRDGEVYDVILLDWRIPVDQGLSLVREIRRHEKNKLARIITLSKTSKATKIYDSVKGTPASPRKHAYSVSDLVEHIYKVLEEEDERVMARLYGDRSVRGSGHHHA